MLKTEDRDENTYASLTTGTVYQTTVYIGKDYERITTTDNGVATVKHRYTLSAGSHTVQIERADGSSLDEPKYLLSDNLGSTNVIVNAKGELEQRLTFDPWGMRTTLGASTTPVNKITNRGYTGHEMDDETGLVNMNARIYDPYLGRFLSADPVLPDPGDLQQFHRYAYVTNNSLKYVDPSGNSAENLTVTCPTLNCGATEIPILLLSFGEGLAGVACRVCEDGTSIEITLVESGVVDPDDIIPLTNQNGPTGTETVQSFITGTGSGGAQVAAGALLGIINGVERATAVEQHFNRINGSTSSLDPRYTGVRPSESANETPGSSLNTESVVPPIAVSNRSRRGHGASNASGSGCGRSDCQDVILGISSAVGGLGAAYHIDPITGDYRDKRGGYRQFLRSPNGATGSRNARVAAALKFTYFARFTGVLSVASSSYDLAFGDVSDPLRASADIAFGLIGFLGPHGAVISTAYFLATTAYDNYGPRTLDYTRRSYR